MMMNPIRIEYGIRSIATNKGIRKMFITSKMAFPMYMLAKRPQTRSGLVVKRSGPGRMPHIMNPASITAVVADPGTPSASSGANRRSRRRLLADSGAATPAMSPFPKVSGCLDAFFSAR